MKVFIALPYIEVQAVVDLPRKWRKAYAPDAHTVTAIEILRAAAASARRRQSDVSVALNISEAKAFVEARRALRRGDQLTPNQAAALAKIRFALVQLHGG